MKRQAQSDGPSSTALPKGENSLVGPRNLPPLLLSLSHIWSCVRRASEAGGYRSRVGRPRIPPNCRVPQCLRKHFELHLGRHCFLNRCPGCPLGLIPVRHLGTLAAQLAHDQDRNTQKLGTQSIRNRQEWPQTRRRAMPSFRLTDMASRTRQTDGWFVSIACTGRT